MKAINLRPIVTENSLNLAQKGWYTFAVPVTLNKNQLKKIIKDLFNVEAIDVKTMIVKGKTKRSWRTRRVTKSSNWKKAIIKLKEGQKLDIFEQVG